MTRPQTDWIVRKRDGRMAPFDMNRIGKAMENAFRAELNLLDNQPLDPEVIETVRRITTEVAEQIAIPASTRQGVDVEDVQDAVEMLMMKHGHYRVARRYIVYRAEHAKLRALRGEEGFADERAERVQITVTLEEGTRVPFDSNRIAARLREACQGLEEVCSQEEILEEVLKSIYDGITTKEIYRAMILAVRARIERDPAYDQVASRLMLNVIYHDALGSAPSARKLEQVYRHQFEHYVIDGIAAERLTPELREYNLTLISEALQPQRDELFQYLGLQTIYDRYLIHVEGRRIETPQFFWMRVAMGLAINEEHKEQRAIEFYNILSTFRFTSATPTLFNSATLHPQLSSCYLSTVSDDLEHIFKVISDNAKLSKWAGGLGNDWTNIRATNAHIHGTNGQSQGVIPFLKVVNDTAVAVNQGGKRKGAVCAYLETWHLDIEDFLELRKNTGDDRRRTHDMHTANWIPDLFMKRVEANAEWTLFSPDEVSDLHDLTGKAFEDRYCYYEKLADEGELRMHRRVSAIELWRKMLTRLFETGHPWITWKDPSNLRSPQDHCGVVHSSNLCTEILLNTSAGETAVCNLGSINLKAHIRDGQLDLEMLRETVFIALRMLDNVIDINYYPTEEAANANQRHRPVGLGIMGFQDALLAMQLSYTSPAAVEFADRSMEAISYYAILASSELARERGRYSTYAGSKWDRGLLPIDTIDLLEEQRGQAIEVDRGMTLDWQIVREAVRQHGMRNSNCMAIAPTATISTIIGVSQSIEPSYKHLYVKSNLSGEFTQINTVLVNELKAQNLWDANMLEAIKYYDGCLSEITRIPEDIRERYKTAFEVDPYWLVECAARRQKWIDMGQSLNLYMQAPNGKKLHEMYLDAWKKGLKTTYYLRTLAATQVEKSTVDVNKFGIQPRWMKSKSNSSDIRIDRAHPDEAQFTEIPATLVGQTCDPNNPDCEACQ
ncbi:MAG: ribonucleoside-diphosphate reductase subunit alpha [Planctomycetaceae bacterium]|nr:ribonucleoside-diphosphate reductase subunit alpha [Planctomycetaceae bacterium]